MTDTNEERLGSLLALKNNRTAARLLTKTNFKVVSVKPILSMPGYAEITIDIDQYPGVPDNEIEEPRYKTRVVNMPRLHLTSAFRMLDYDVNADGSFVVPDLNVDATVTEVIELLASKIALLPTDFSLRKNGEQLVLIANINSLGFTGYVTLTATADEPVTEPVQA